MVLLQDSTSPLEFSNGILLTWDRFDTNRKATHTRKLIISYKNFYFVFYTHYTGSEYAICTRTQSLSDFSCYWDYGSTLDINSVAYFTLGV